jgi:hypothetical protein
LIDISLHDTFTELTNLDPSKAKGIDDIGPLMLKMCATPLCTPLHHLVSISLKTACLPSEWKVHKIVRVFKCGDKTSVYNYRPISLLCSVSKVLERLIYNKVIDFLYPLLSSSLYGFLSGRSSLKQLLTFLSDVHDNESQGLETNVIYLDFRKAFDTVPDDKLLQKL